ncbi:SIR2 family protein, partial [Cronobacter sakazakii]|nr:SIR2 family protein [Cronobacter sakazakii]
LITLYNLEMLNKSDTTKLIKNLWSKRDNFGFPIGSGYYKFFFINNLNPDNENIADKFISIIKTYKFPVQEGKRVSITGGLDEYCTELNGALHHISLPEKTLSEIISKIHDWYVKDRAWLEKRDDLAKEFTLRFRNITNIITTILEHHKDKLHAESINEISSLLDKMKEDKIPVNSAVTMLCLKNKSTYLERIKDIENGLYSFNKDDVIEAINSTYVFIRNNEFPLTIIQAISDKIAWDRNPRLPDCYNLIAYIINSCEFTLPDYLIEKILRGLAYQINIDDRDFVDNNEYLNHLEKKLSATKLAASMFRKNETLGIDQPSIIQEWKNMCNSRNEFDEIRNEWNNNI